MMPVIALRRFRLPFGDMLELGHTRSKTLCELFSWTGITPYGLDATKRIDRVSDVKPTSRDDILVGR